MAAFDGWIARVTPERHRAIFMAYPVAFDWMFVAWYFHRFLHRNPFGISGLDLRSYYAGMKGTSYTASGKQDMDAQFTAGLALTHNAVEDAVAQARLFDRIRHRS
jgi:hypothetical protein